MVSVKLVGGPNAAGLSSPKTPRIIGFVVKVAAAKVITTGLSVWVLSPTFFNAALLPVLVIPDTASTVKPLPVAPVISSVKTVDVPEPIKLLRIEIQRAPAVPPPVERGFAPICVYVPLPSELLSVIASVSPDAQPDIPWITTIKSFTAGVAVTVWSPEVVQLSPNSETVAICFKSV